MNINMIESYFGQALPRLYKDFLLTHRDELKGDICLYLAEDVIERNECYETQVYAKGYISIGDNGGGEAFIIALGEADPAVWQVCHGMMDPDMKELVYPCFSHWIAADFEYKNI